MINNRLLRKIVHMYVSKGWFSFFSERLYWQEILFAISIYVYLLLYGTDYVLISGERTEDKIWPSDLEVQGALRHGI